MTEPVANDRMSDRYASLASKSANEAQAAANRADLAVGGEEPRDAKRARREAKEWAETCLKDAMRAHGAFAAETGRFEATHEGAEAALRKAEAARDHAAQVYREMKGGTRDAD
jgi:hypothetical protein